MSAALAMEPGECMACGGATPDEAADVCARCVDVCVDCWGHGELERGWECPACHGRGVTTEPAEVPPDVSWMLEEDIAW